MRSLFEDLKHRGQPEKSEDMVGFELVVERGLSTVSLKEDEVA
jgi:hypothetical protein